MTLLLNSLVYCINSPHAQGPLCCHRLLVFRGVDSLIFRPVCMVDAGITSVLLINPLLYKRMCLPGLSSTFMIFLVATTYICLLLHLVRTLTPLLSSGLSSPLLPKLQRPNLMINIISWYLILKQSDHSLVFPYKH